MVNSKSKGKRYELEISSALRQRGYNARRTAQYCGSSGDAADVVGLDYVHIECKRTERLDLYGAVDQATRDSKTTGKKPAVFHRKNNCDTVVIMRLDDWLDLYAAYELQQSEG